MVNINDFMQEKTCMYKGEIYSVRDNGAIMRHRRDRMRMRKLDEIWTFGNPNDHTGYMEFGGERVHRIVATAFHGEAPSDQHVVDHIDTNRKNNRPLNLRWLTKLENILLNEITQKKVELICGSVEAFLDNPSLLRGHESEDINFGWMKNVTKEEAKNCRDNWTRWARTTTATHDPNYKKKEIGDGIYQSFKTKPVITSPTNKKQMETLLVYDKPLPDPMPIEKQIDIDNRLITESNTPLAAQYYWKTPTDFPCCPNVINEDGLLLYKENLKEGNIFTSNQYDTYYVVDKGMKKDSSELIVLATNNKEGFLSWSLVSIWMREGKYVHESIERKLGKELSIKYFKCLIGEGDLSIDDIYTLDCLA